MQEFSEDITPKIKNIFSNDNINLIEKDESKKLGLRKKFIDNYLSDLRKKEILKDKTKFEIDVSKLNISQEYQNFNLTDLNDDDQIQTVLFMLSSDNLPYIKFGVYLLRKFICQCNSEKEVIYDKKEIYNELIKVFLNNKRTDYELRYEIYWILINSTENNQYLLKLIDNENFNQELEKDFSLNNENLNEMIIWLCCHLLDDSEIFLLKFPKTKIFEKTLKILTQRIQTVNSISPLIVQSLKLIHIFIGKNRHAVDKIPIQVLNDIVLILLKFSGEMNHQEIRLHVLFTLYFLLDNDFHNVKALVLQDHQLLKNILNFEINPELKENQLFIRIIGNLLRGNDVIVDYLLADFKVFDYLLEAFKRLRSELIHQEILWSLSNLTAGTLAHIMHFLTSDFYIISRDYLKSNNNQIQRLSLKILYNIISMDFFDISMKIIDEELIILITKILSVKNSRPENKTLCLSLLKNIFFIGKFNKKTTNNSDNSSNFNELDFDIKPDNENDFINIFLKNEGKEVLNELQLDANEEIFKKTKLIIQKYFSFEEQ